MPSYANPFGSWQGGASEFNRWLHPNAQSDIPPLIQDSYKGATGLGALSNNMVKSWTMTRGDNFKDWLNNRFNSLNSQYEQEAMAPGNTGLQWLDWLSQKASNIMTDYATASPVEQGARPYDYVNLRTRWQR
jgi:hypothetical protein